jgi:glycosyltransferase involved in cell wall biosynthesis
MASPTPKRSYDVILTSNYSPWSRYSGGGQKSTHMLGTVLAGQGLKVAVVFSRAPWEKVPLPKGLPYDLHWAWFLGWKPGVSSPLRFLNGLTFWARVRGLSGPGTALHGNGDEASLLSWVRRKRRFVFSNRYPEFPSFLHGRDWSRPATWMRILLREPRFVALALALRRADAVTTTSASSRHQVMEAFGPEMARPQVVPNGVDPVALALPITPVPRLGVLFYGRLTRAKGADLVLEAYALLPATLRERHVLRIFGQGPLLPDLQRRAAALGIPVEFPGWMTGEALALEIQVAKVVCLPSREESFGNTVAETLALGQTLVTSRAGSIPEVAGPWGRLVEGFRPGDFAAALAEELARERDPKDREAQREYVRGRFAWSCTAERYRELYGLPAGREIAEAPGKATP